MPLMPNTIGNPLQALPTVLAPASSKLSVSQPQLASVVGREQSLPQWSNSNMARRWQQKCPEFGLLHLSTLILNDLLKNSRTRATTNRLGAGNAESAILSHLQQIPVI